jgi:hypothetical protein
MRGKPFRKGPDPRRRRLSDGVAVERAGHRLWSSCVERWACRCRCRCGNRHGCLSRTFLFEV